MGEIITMTGSMFMIPTLPLILKKGYASLPSKSGSFSVISVMAKLFSSILYGRIASHIDNNLAEAQFGFQKGIACSDAVHLLRAIIKQSLEWWEELWGLAWKRLLLRSISHQCFIVCRINVKWNRFVRGGFVKPTSFWKQQLRCLAAWRVESILCHSKRS